MERKTNYGKIIAITLSIVTASCAIAFVLYRLIRNLISFCTVYEEPEEIEDYPEFDEALAYEEEVPTVENEEPGLEESAPEQA